MIIRSDDWFFTKNLTNFESTSKRTTLCESFEGKMNLEFNFTHPIEKEILCKTYLKQRSTFLTLVKKNIWKGKIICWTKTVNVVLFLLLFILMNFIWY